MYGLTRIKLFGRERPIRWLTIFCELIIKLFLKLALKSSDTTNTKRLGEF